MRTIQASKFKATCLELMDEIATSGERVVITKHGKPISVLSPYSEKPETLFGLHSGSMKIMGDLVEPVDEPWAECFSSPTPSVREGFASLALAKHAGRSSKSMSKPDPTEMDDDLRPEYDLAILKNGVRGKYFDRFQAGTNLVLLEPDVAQAFPTAESVNQALKMLMRVAESSSKLPAA